MIFRYQSNGLNVTPVNPVKTNDKQMSCFVLFKYFFINIERGNNRVDSNCEVHQ